MTGVVVRPAAIADATEVFAAWQELRAHYAATDRRIVPSPVTRAEFEAAFQERLGRDEAASFVAMDGKRVAGFITGAIERNQPDRLPELYAAVGHLYVAGEYRRHGLGQELFAAFAAWAARRDGVDHFEMPVLAADDEAVHFWQSIGFSPFIERLWAPLSAPEMDA